MSENVFSQTGGARVGWLNASFPLATLRVSADQLTLDVVLAGSYSFNPDQVVSIEKYRGISLVGCGLHIRHTIADYPSKIIFWHAGDSKSVLERIQTTGFIAQAHEKNIPAKNGIPIRWSAVLILIAIWNSLFALGMQNLSPHEIRPFAGWSALSLFLLLLASHAIMKSTTLQTAILKPGRSFKEIRHYVYFTRFLLALLFPVFCLVWIFD